MRLLYFSRGLAGLAVVNIHSRYVLLFAFAPAPRDKVFFRDDLGGKLKFEIFAFKIKARVTNWRDGR